MSTTQSKYGRRFDEEFKREVAALASRPRARQEQVRPRPGREPLQRVTLEEALRPGTGADAASPWLGGSEVSNHDAGQRGRLSKESEPCSSALLRLQDDALQRL